jgi:hypothetical protein
MLFSFRKRFLLKIPLFLKKIKKNVKKCTFFVDFFNVPAVEYVLLERVQGCIYTP